MNPLVRRLRGVLGIGLTWGILWAAIGAAVALVIGVVDPESIDPGEGPIVVSAIIGLVGFISGIGFGSLLSIAESRKTILDLSLTRVAMWGILGSAALPLLTGMENGLMLITCPLGAVFATASVVLARRAELHDSEPPRLLNSEPRSRTQP